MDFDTFVRAEIGGLTRYAGVLVRDRQLAHDVLADALIGARRCWRPCHPRRYRRGIPVIVSG